VHSRRTSAQNHSRLIPLYAWRTRLGKTHICHVRLLGYCCVMSMERMRATAARLRKLRGKGYGSTVAHMHGPGSNSAPRSANAMTDTAPLRPCRARAPLALCVGSESHLSLGPSCSTPTADIVFARSTQRSMRPCSEHAHRMHGVKRVAAAERGPAPGR